MTNKKVFLVSFAVAFYLGLALWPTKTHEQTIQFIEAEAETEIQQGPQLTEAQIEWIDRLRQCESGGRPGAINEIDLDGTPSFGLFQFKPSTFIHFAARYGVEGELMDPVAQRSIVEQMVLERDLINWTQQFPGCVRKLGLPPAA